MDDANNSYKIVSADDMGLPVDLLMYLDTYIKKYWTGVYSSWTYIVDHGDGRKKFYAREVILKLFAHLKDKNFIDSFIQIKQGVTAYSVKFSFDL